MGISIQHTSQIGTEESCGRGEPQREHEAGNRTDPTASRGLRSTRATARHADVCDADVSAGGSSIVSEPESLRKTHLDSKGAAVSRLHLYLYAQSNSRGKQGIAAVFGHSPCFPDFYAVFIRLLCVRWRP